MVHFKWTEVSNLWKGGENVIRISKESHQTINELIRQGKIDSAMLSTTSFVDEIILAMKQHGIIDCLQKGFIDKRY